MSKILSTYKIKNVTMLRLHFLYTTWFIRILFKTKRFDCLIKTNVSTSRDLLKSTNRSIQLAYDMLLVLSYELVLLHHVNVLLKIDIQKASLDNHLSNLIIEISLYRTIGSSLSLIDSLTTNRFNIGK